MLFALAGWLVGYKGEFLFDNIGDSYIANHVPYVAYRSMPAMMGALTVPIVFLVMWESGYSLPAAVTAAGLLLFDNGHIGQTRLILLDATLVFFMALAVLCYVRFYKLRHVPFSRKWWKWLLLTGICLSCVISTKYVGIFTFFSIGVPVMIDLWGLMDINRRQGALSMDDFIKHFLARAVGLVVIPFFFYLFWFQVHFSILSRSGPGDDFMSPEFQETLSDNVMTMQAVGINYFDSISMLHKETKVYLHSHTERYPLRYDDGRVSSQGQQVTGYPHNDTNNHWQLIPTKHLPSNEDQPVQHGDVVRLRHLVTDTLLLTHDVASPYFPTNQEFTTIGHDEGDNPEARFNDTLFEIRIESAKPGQQFKTKSSHFKLIHVPTKVALWTHTTPLPDWAFKQAEINGNKNSQQTSNIWYVEDIPSLSADSERNLREPRKVKSLPFLSKYFELQRAMFFHNNALTSSHPYASFPISWPFLLRGVSFWTSNETREQIYFLGNPIGWWIASSLLAVFAGIVGADQLALRRGVDSLDQREYRHPSWPIRCVCFVHYWLQRSELHASFRVISVMTRFPLLFKTACALGLRNNLLRRWWRPYMLPYGGKLTRVRPGTRIRLYDSTGFFFLTWAAHYVPFYIMGRQLFLHHYLPAHLASCLVAGALVEFVCCIEPIDADSPLAASHSADSNNSSIRKGSAQPDARGDSGDGPLLPVRERMLGSSRRSSWTLAVVVLASVVWCFFYFAPLTYGRPGLSVEQIKARKWGAVGGYDLHFAK